MHNKSVRSWIMYDWACSGFSTSILAAIMPLFFSEVAGKGLPPHVATAYWGYTQSIALFFVVLLSPMLGSVADLFHSKKLFLRFFTYLGVIISFLMFTIGEGQWLWACFLVIVGTLAFSSACIFYDAFLVDVVPQEKLRDKISTQGYAIGYVGGGILLALNFGLIQFHDIFHLSSIMAVKISFLSVGVWWLVFALPFFLNVKEKREEHRQPIPLSSFFSGFKSVLRTIRHIQHYPELFKFLLAFWFFSDGINTIIKMATIYGTEIGIGTTDLLLALLITQFIGLPCTLLFGKIAGKIGAKPTLIITLCIYLVIVTLGYFMTSALHFYLLAIMVGTVQGGSQALSRSIYSRLVPEERNSEFFGFYGLSGKFAAIFGPALFGIIGQITGSSRLGIISLATFFLFGILILLNIDIEKGKAQVG